MDFLHIHNFLQTHKSWALVKKSQDLHVSGQRMLWGQTGSTFMIIELWERKKDKTILSERQI